MFIQGVTPLDVNPIGQGLQKIQLYLTLYFEAFQKLPTFCCFLNSSHMYGHNSKTMIDIRIVKKVPFPKQTKKVQVVTEISCQGGRQFVIRITQLKSFLNPFKYLKRRQQKSS
uniref:Uncharacterized protein n=1 Tax=Cacopsylla melanoneura TaxID=428564 RepID=A0A8D9F2B9_9HEMI